MTDVVVVGAGVVGASVAWHLGKLGVRDVLLLEREPAPGQGSTGRATGGFRAQFSTEINVRLSLLAREKLRRFRDETGVDPGYTPCGYLWLARAAEQLAVLRAAQGVQRAAGLGEARMLDASEIPAVNPAVRVEGLAGAAFCPTDGFIRPPEILRGYLQGARVRTGADVLGFRCGAAGRIEKVLTASEEIPAGCVVNAAGPWAAEVARLAGVDLPVAPLRRHVAVTAETGVLPADMPMTIWVEDGFHIRVRDGRVLLLMQGEGEGWRAAVERCAAERVVGLGGVPVESTYSGFYEMSPDGHAILGRAPGCENLFLANGSSGHGVMHAPALGQLLAEMIVHGEARSLDARALRPSRFAEGRPNPASELL